MTVLGTALVALALSTDPSTLALGDATLIGATASFTDGTRPGGVDFSQRTWWLEIRHGTAFRDKTTGFGAQVGYELGGRFGMAEAETPGGEDPAFDFVGFVGLPVRIATFNTPFEGMLVTHVALEVGAGGDHWWSDSARVAAAIGLRLALRPTSWMGAEIGYDFAPFVTTGAPDPLEVARMEHRVAVAVALGPAALGGRFVAASLDVRDAGFRSSESTELTFEATLEARF